MEVLKCRKKPMVIEAVQVDDTNECWDFLSDWTDGSNFDYVDVDDSEDGEPYFMLSTLEGPMKVIMGSYIMKGINGEFWAIREDIFNKTYDVLDGDEEYHIGDTVIVVLRNGDTSNPFNWSTASGVIRDIRGKEAWIKLKRGGKTIKRMFSDIYQSRAYASRYLANVRGVETV